MYIIELQDVPSTTAEERHASAGRPDVIERHYTKKCMTLDPVTPDPVTQAFP